MNHLLDLNSLNISQIQTIFERSDFYLKNAVEKEACFDHLRGKILVNLLFEPSTRTRLSFEIAAQRLGAIVLSPDLTVSSLKKNESLKDMALTLEALGARFIVIRHPHAGIPQRISEYVSEHTSVINAGDGDNHHPTQALIDLFTIQKQLSHLRLDWPQLSVALIGDLRHSRVVHSLIDGLLKLNIGHIRLAAPETFLYKTAPNPHIQNFQSIEPALVGADIVMAFRLQKERITAEQTESYSEISTQFILTPERLKLAKPTAFVMHPGPINRELEMTTAVADGPQSLILQQVKNGVAVRMAILELLSFFL